MILFTVIAVILTALLESWVVLAVTFTHYDPLHVYLLCGIILNFSSVVSLFYMVLKVLYSNTCAKENMMKSMFLGADYWAPYPRWEWNDEPLLLNACDYSKENGWDDLYPKKILETNFDIEEGCQTKQDSNELSPNGKEVEQSLSLSNTIQPTNNEIGYEQENKNEHETKQDSNELSPNGKEVEQSLSPSNTIQPTNNGIGYEQGNKNEHEAVPPQVYEDECYYKDIALYERMKDILTHEICLPYKVECIKPTKKLPLTCSLNSYENHYISTAKEKSKPTAIVTVCYLLAKDSNTFLLESIDYFKKVHKSPLYVMMNAREKGDWIQEQLDIISSFVDQNYGGQVRVFFVENSRSKAANLNASVDILQNDGYQNFKYVWNYDIDDRPTFNEASALAYVERVVGKWRAGTKIVGIQGPCLECFNGTLSGLMENHYEFNAQCETLLIRSRIGLKTESQGSNHLILSGVYRRYRFDNKVLLEDWRWSNDMKEKDNIGLLFVRTMVCYGQTPYGFKAVMRRRNRWVKGRWIEWIHDAFGRPIFTPLFKEWIIGFLVIFKFLIILPVLHLLMINGYVLIRSEAHAGFFVLNLQKLEEFTDVPVIIGKIWNLTLACGLAPLLGIIFVHAIMKVIYCQSGFFLNGRDSLKYRVCYAYFIIVDAFFPFLSPFTLYYQYQYYCLIEYILGKITQKKTVWVPTPKISKEDSMININSIA